MVREDGMWVWEKLSGSQWMDAWEERFHGNPNLVIHLLKGGKSLRVEVFCESRKSAEAIMKQFGGRVRELKNADWQKPMEVSPPLKIRDRFLVTQEDRKAQLKVLAKDFPGREILSIPPEMAFGTGDHATTSTCLRLLVDIGRSREAGWSCADLGCGTGVLAIAARKLGAGDTFACDYDPFAVKVTERNAIRNQVAGIETREVDILKWKPKKAYDVVLANIFSTVLIEAFPVIAKMVRPGGDLVLSGILHSQAWGVFEAAAGYGLGFNQVIRKGKWVTARGGWMADLDV
ncbi:ribosomal protein L11 methyltransferase [Haloferula luteola]|uniref:Ribosomal protein L11 methyltransferase n=1 Tax=Haloferula luteola TaxID=595692 RepID=A0A840VBA7_9BACT|nr:50S ribosomal protein L11 methyltransferase [Haloferula luteola]MBB5352834.1 ribosomal protein L11 methyltransferase [Haloferula luteola]